MYAASHAVLLAGGQNEYVWQSWAMLESRCGNIGQARKLFDAALVANRGHAAAWHGWGLMEKRQGNLLKAKDIWVKVRLDTIVRVRVIWNMLSNS